METQIGHVQQDGVRIRATTTDELIAVLKGRRGELRSIAAELKPKSCGLTVEECFDGPWSRTIIQAARQLGAIGVEVNEPWAAVPPDWTCPCCGRAKADIVHLSNGILIAKLVEHHDHFTSYINRVFVRTLGKEWSRRHPGATDVHRAMMDAFLAFSPVVVCESCNKADKDAKDIVATRLGVAAESLADFTFSIDEIGSFTDKGANRHHVPDPKRVVEIFRGKRKAEILDFRRQTVDQQVELIGQGVHWRAEERHPSQADVDETARDLLAELGMNGSGNFDLLRFSATTRVGSLPSNLWRRNRTGRPKRPMDAKIEAAVAESSELKELGASWRCPCCKRSLHAIMRFNNKGGLFAHTQAVGRGEQRKPVCMDCHEVWAGLAREADVDRDTVTQDDVVAVIRPIRHGRHRLSSELAADRRISAIQARSARENERRDWNASEDPFAGPGFVAI